MDMKNVKMVDTAMAKINDVVTAVKDALGRPWVVVTAAKDALARP